MELLTNASATHRQLELIEFEVPFCGPFACAYADNGAPNGSASAVLWDCMPGPCRRRIEGFTALLLLLAALTTALNGAVLAANLLPSTRRIVRRNPTMENYSMYVLSMALADLLVGSVVLPTVLAFLHYELTAERRPGLRSATAGGNLSIPDGSLTQRALSSGSGSGSGSATLVNSVGVVTHLAVFVSMYTLAAASADRFYTSTKPISTKSINLSSSSFRRKLKTLSCLKLQRSTFLVVLIWMLGVLFSMVPLFLYPKFQYSSIGHAFVVLASNSKQSFMAYWYAGALLLPLVTTWIFSSLICFTLWRRKRRLKNSYSSRNGSLSRSQRSRGSSRRRHRGIHRRPSVTESHVTQSGIDRFANDSEALNPNSKISDDSVCVLPPAPPTPVVPLRKQIHKMPIRKTMSSPAGVTTPSRAKRRPSSLDTALIKQIASLQDGVHHKRTLSQPSTPPHHPQMIDDCFVAKKLLCRRSWGGCPDDVRHRTDAERSRSPLGVGPLSGSFANIVFSPAPSPTLSLKVPAERKVEPQRNPRTPTRLRRKSSVFRAREMLRSKSLESNIVKTLVAVVIAISTAIVPLLIVIAQIAGRGAFEMRQMSRDVSALVICMTVLFSNSLWNCLIYGARMPYFRRSVQRFSRKNLRRFKAACCCRRLRRSWRHALRKRRSGGSVRGSPRRDLQLQANREELIVSDVFSTMRCAEDSRECNYVMKQC